ncbi:MAG: hypothetical protein K2H62_04485, partial [Bacteroidales bacterium]|nr:hypothetical protein [Bacteroidales bacterium]
MKKIGFLLTAVALLAGGAGIKAQDVSPRHVYFSEGFSGKGVRYDIDIWNLEADSGYKRMYYSAGTATGGEAPEAVWGYAPASGLKELLLDTVRLVSYPYDLQKASRSYLSMKYKYQASQGTDDGVHSFGLAARRPGGDWVLCGVMGNGGLKSSEGPGQLVAELPSGLKDAAEVCVYMQNRIDFGSMSNIYMLYFDDIEFFGYPEAYYDLAFSWGGQPYVFVGDETEDLSVRLQMENVGNAFKTGKVAYTFDGGATQYIDLAFDEPLYPGQTYSMARFTPEGWAQAAEGHHTLVFWLAEADGVALAETAVSKQRKVLSKLAPATVTTYPCRPLVEEFSSSTCSACAWRNKSLQPIFEALADSISVVKYQMNFPGSGDPYYTGEGGLRSFFYNVLDIPAICLDGKKESGSSTGKLLAALREKIQSSAYVDLTFDTLALDADTNVYVVLKVR